MTNLRDNRVFFEKSNMADNLDLEQWKCWCNILSANSNVSLSCVKWDDVTNALVGIKVYTKFEEYR